MKNDINLIIKILCFVIVAMNIAAPACADDSINVHEFLSGLTICKPLVYEGIAVFPLASDKYPDNISQRSQGYGYNYQDHALLNISAAQ